MINTFQRRLFLMAAALMLAPNFVSAQAVEAWPDKPVKLIVPFPSGGPTDTVARIITTGLQIIWKQPVVVDYKPGAGTTLGTNIVAKSPADGYTLGMAITALTINPSLQANLPYDTKKDLVGVSQVAQAHFGLFAHPSQPFNTMQELIDYAKKNPNALSYATPGTGTGTHLAGEMLASMAGIRLLHIPYKGSTPALTDLMGGQVQMMFDNMPTAWPLVQAGKLRVLAITSPKRSPAAPDVPTMQESGFPGFDVSSWFGLAAPAGTPKEIIAKLNVAMNKVLAKPDVQKRLDDLGATNGSGTVEQFDQFLKSQTASWGVVVKSAGAKAE
jgi:tripartite-type tricarboxylate transporter receptor subunit TctC